MLSPAEQLEARIPSCTLLQRWFLCSLLSLLHILTEAAGIFYSLLQPQIHFLGKEFWDFQSRQNYPESSPHILHGHSPRTACGTESFAGTWRPLNPPWEMLHQLGQPVMTFSSRHSPLNSLSLNPFRSLIVTDRTP